MKNLIIAPSILSADFSDFKSAVKAIEESGADFIHLDVMDGHFVPEITFGKQTVLDIRSKTTLPMDVHLMVDKPENHIEGFAESGADYITIHIENGKRVEELLLSIKKFGAKAGISIKPATPLSDLSPILHLVDLVLIMGVNPGYGGQKMFPQTAEKIARLKSIRDEKSLNFLISIDGGVNEETIPGVVEAGTDILVTGSYFFKCQNKMELVEKLHNIL